MSTYKELMDEIKISDTRKKRIKNLYSQENKNTTKHYNVKKVMKSAIAIAACVAVVLVSGTFGTNLLNKNAPSFSLTVNAAEVAGNDKNVTLYAINPDGGNFSETEKGGAISYFIETPFSCKGDNIESITYKINKGAFQIIGPKGKSIITSGKKYQGKLNTPSASIKDDDVMELYSEYTLDYNKQSSDDMIFALCGISNVSSTDAFFNLDGKHSLDSQNQQYHDALSDVIVTCTVKYSDGTTQNKTIQLGSKIMTPNEAIPDNNWAEPDKEMVFPIFEVK